MSEKNARAMRDMRKMGHVPWVVERFIRFPPPGHSVDLYNIIDIVAIKADERGVSGVQVTSGPNVNSRVKKAYLCDHLPTWLQAGNRFEVWGYRKMGKAGKRKLWKLRREAAQWNPEEGIYFVSIEDPIGGVVDEDSRSDVSAAVLSGAEKTNV